MAICGGGGRVRVAHKGGSKTPRKAATAWSPPKKTSNSGKVVPPIVLDLSPVEAPRRLDVLDQLPLDVILRTFFLLGVPSFASVTVASRAWREISSHDALWREFYRERFDCESRLLRRLDAPETLELSFATPASAREVSQVSPASPRPRVVIRRNRSTSPSNGCLSPQSSNTAAAALGADALSPHGGVTSPRSPRSFKSRFRRRFESPIIGDKIEVSWHGKFRLESCEVHAGCAWWAASVVDKLKLHDEDGDQWWYKVTFPGWQGRWDEWVPRPRLRWPTLGDAAHRAAELKRQIKPRDSVEVWCNSKNVPGAWLEAKVIKIKNNKYLIGRAQTLNGDPIWVDRSRLRLSPKSDAAANRDRAADRGTRNPLLAKIGLCSPRHGAGGAGGTPAGAMPSFVGRGFVEAVEPEILDEAELIDV